MEITYEGRKTTIPRSTTYEELVAKISSSFNIQPSSFYLTYLDEDEDLIHVSNE